MDSACAAPISSDSFHASSLWAYSALKKISDTTKKHRPSASKRQKEGCSLNFDCFASRTEVIRPRLYRMAFGYLGSEAMALDAVDEAVYKGLKKLSTLREEALFETWLTRILINVCKQELRRRRRELPSPLPEEAQEAFDALPIREAVRRLPEPLKEVVALRFFADLTVAQTAEALGIPKGTVAARQRRALSLLRLELGGDDPI